MTGNEIGAEGAKTISEVLKVNSTLTTLDLGSEEERKEREEKEKKEERMTVNRIGDEGKEMVKNAWGSRKGTLYI